MPGLPHQYFAATRRPGYSGTAVLSRTPAMSWRGGNRRHTVSDEEGRVVTVGVSPRSMSSASTCPTASGVFRGCPCACGGTRSSVRTSASSRAKKPVVFCGDMNVAHEEIDIARPRDNRMNAGFTDRGAAQLHPPAGGGIHRHLPGAARGRGALHVVEPRDPRAGAEHRVAHRLRMHLEAI